MATKKKKKKTLNLGITILPQSVKAVAAACDSGCIGCVSGVNRPGLV